MSTKTTWDIQIVTHSIHIRKDPVYKKDGSNVVGYAFNGNKFTASKYQNGWFYIDSKKGWVKEKGSTDNKTYVKVLKKNTVTTAKPAEEVKKDTKKTDTTKTEVKPEETKSTDNTSTAPKTTTYTAEPVNTSGNLVTLEDPYKEESTGVEGHLDFDGEAWYEGVNGDDDKPPNVYKWADDDSYTGVNGDDDAKPNDYKYDYGGNKYTYTGVDGDDDTKPNKYPYVSKGEGFNYRGVNGDDNRYPAYYKHTDKVGSAARWGTTSRPDKTILTAMSGANTGGLHFNEKWGTISHPLSYGNYEKDFATVRFNHNIMNLDDREKHFTHFNRFRLPVPDMALNKTIPYVFFTRPDLSLITSDGKNLKDSVMGDSTFSSLFNDQPKLFHNLDSAYLKNDNFNLFLSNSAMSFQTSDEVLKTVEHGETYTGWKMVYGRHTNESNTAGQFSIQYIDDYNYNIYKMHKLWLTYINKVYRGEVEVSRTNIWQKILTYPCSVYYIVCAPDGETILFWAKYFGVFPLNTPSSASSFTHGATNGFPEFSINYMYSIKEDMNPVALREFNLLSTGKLQYRETYNSAITGPSRTFVNAPYIDDVVVNSNGVKKTKFKLRFRNA